MEGWLIAEFNMRAYGYAYGYASASQRVRVPIGAHVKFGDKAITTTT